MPLNHRLCFYPLAAFSLLLGFTACTESEEDDPGDKNPKYTIPASYSAFENVDFSGQTARLDMLQELSAYMKSGNTAGTLLDAGKMKSMFANEDSAFSKAELNSATSKKLKDKTFEPDRAYFESLFDGAAAASKDTLPGEKGRAGRIARGTGAILVSDKGQEYAQLVEKGLMGACFYYQSLASYLIPEGKLASTLDKATLEHHWDEAYGYFSSSTKFPDSGATRFWSKYAKDIDQHIGSNARILRAFVLGRAAIVNGDRETMLKAVDSVRFEWERVSAATAIHYMNAAKAKLTDDGERNHSLSEGIAFVKALKYNPGKKITDEQLTQALGHIGEDFYEVTQSGLDSAIDLLSSIYGLGDVKATL